MPNEGAGHRGGPFSKKSINYMNVKELGNIVRVSIFLPITSFPMLNRIWYDAIPLGQALSSRISRRSMPHGAPVLLRARERKIRNRIYQPPFFLELFALNKHDLKVASIGVVVTLICKKTSTQLSFEPRSRSLPGVSPVKSGVARRKSEWQGFVAWS